MSNVINLFDYRRRATIANFEQSPEILAYRAKIQTSSRAQLIDEMIRFQKERRATGMLTRELMVKGKYLFTALESAVDSKELRIMSRSYARHLEYELAALDDDAS